MLLSEAGVEAGAEVACVDDVTLDAVDVLPHPARTAAKTKEAPTGTNIFDEEPLSSGMRACPLRYLTVLIESSFISFTFHFDTQPRVKLYTPTSHFHWPKSHIVLSRISQDPSNSPSF